MEQKHSILGIASTIIAILEIIMWYCNWMGTIDVNAYGDVLGFFIYFVLPFAPLILGIGGLIQKNRRKKFPILGIILSILPICYIALLYVVVTFLEY